METREQTLRRNLTICQQVCDQLKIPYREVVSLKVNTTAKRRFGQCRRLENDKFEISISDRLLKEGLSQLTLMNTMLHELLHTCDGCMNHGKLWKSYAARLNNIGYTIERCATSAEMAEAPTDESAYRYKVTCCDCIQGNMEARICRWRWQKIHQGKRRV